MQPLRELNFWLRNALRLSLPAWKRAVPLAAVRSELDGARLAALEGKYDLGPWAALCNAQDWRESLYVLDLLDTVLPADLPPGRALDVGSKNGAYFPGLATARPAGWDGVELDAHRRYAWGSTRRVYGERMAAAFPDCRFLSGDVRAVQGAYALVTWFLPFLSEAPLEAWGLPKSALAPDALFTHVVSLVAPGGALLVVNQGAHEAQLQQALFTRAGLPVRALGRLTPALSPWKKERFGFLFRQARGPAAV